ncbi:MAG TPA: D-alanyl-D-alanine carboxypeptidase family protein [Actinophytocola sp.]|uniref:D-alanyl-D-alanine carboxypeptidase family protein n=1 Tax=Actinophytocola sp. TaxID=1872138 RepID=UPI002DDC91D4|nr:D-alanyl-D-alanine carboxypeptidase family protein [Actinophytocola sp.]HEV2780934.1 D-alanyl-D-alanine carboxypeptidase family protein [Actinophytocola sp.]
MSRLSAREIAEHAYAAGFRGQALTTAVAVALAESGGNPKARGDTTITDGTWGPSIGLWQIRSLRSDYGTGDERDAKANLDPATNARHAWSISDHGTNWTPWSAYTNGSYRRYLDTARAAAQQVAGGHSGGGGHSSGGGQSGGERSDGERRRRPARGDARPASDRIVLDLHELRELHTFFDRCADRVRHVRRVVADIERDLEPARAALTDTALAGLITQAFAFLQSPPMLPKAEERMDWHARFAERVRRLAERADGADGKWTRSDALRFATGMGRADRAERAVLEALIMGTIVRRRSDLRQHLHRDRDRDHEPRSGDGTPARVDVSGLRNGHVPASRLASVGDGEKLLEPVARAFRRMDAAARAAGLDLHVNSGYRSYAEQAQLYRDYQNGTGNLAAPPGRSTHGLGLSADINVTNPRVQAWLRENAAKYGFVNDVASEPWHWTYQHR